jgi:acetylornithine deacetylase/succinyl-diaminopimelate desuccinylase-like protein
MRSDVTFLAADAQEGREPGTRGIEVSADYIASAFKAAGLKPAQDSLGYFQPFTISGRPTLGQTQTLRFKAAGGEDLEAKLKGDFMPLAIGAGATLTDVPVVFVGYGISTGTPALAINYDDYAGIDVKGKAVLILRREPQQHQESSPFDGKRDTRYATFERKATNAFRHGAAAVLLVNNLAGLDGADDRLLAFHQAGVEVYSNIPFVMLSRSLADELLSRAGAPILAELEKGIDQDLKPRSRTLKDCTVSMRIAIDVPRDPTKNVVGVLEGDGSHAGETVVVGGHYDHLGHGGPGSLAFFSRDIHNGADDNASGTAMVIEMARRLGARRDPLPRRVVFIAFSGEERGLLGSEYYVAHPLFPLAETVMMINCDMVGRLNARSELTMIGTGTAQGEDAIVEALGNSAGLKIKKVSGTSITFGDSDHAPFYKKQIPILFAFTGLHGDYHRPSDDSERINFAGMERIADYLELLALDIVRRPERPVFLKVAQAPRTAARPAAAPTTGPSEHSGATRRVSVGTLPDYDYKAGDGLRITGVREGSPADKGGLREGDLIVRFGARAVGTIYDYMAALEACKPGDQVEVLVKREGREVKLVVTPEGLPTD